MRIAGNKGEWSELYAFVKLLSTGRLYAADEDVNRIDDVFFPILKIIRTEEKSNSVDYVVCSEDGSVEIHLYTDKVGRVKRERLITMASKLYDGILAGCSRAFEIEDAPAIMEELNCKRIAAPSEDKTDITIQIHDIHTGYNPVCGFSIKSELGSAPTLLNASGATNFVFEVTGITQAQADEINAISTSSKIIDRVNKVYEYGSLKFEGVKNQNFSGNLMLLDTYMDSIIAELLLDYYKNNVGDCKTLVSRLEERNPLGYSRSGIYEYKMKKFLCSVALGMMPSKVWDGRDEANGGYVIVKDDGDVLAYHIYNRDSFEAYLLKNTKFERGSTTKHHFASIYSENGKFYMNLNLQVRFI